MIPPFVAAFFAKFAGQLLAAGAVIGAVLGLWLYIGALKHDAAQAKADASAWHRAADGFKYALDHGAKVQAVTDHAEQTNVAAQVKVQTLTRTIIQKVPEYVTVKADAACVLPVGLIRVYNASALGVPVESVPAPTGLSDDAPSGIPCSALAADLADNFGLGHANATDELTGQNWAVQQEALAP